MKYIIAIVGMLSIGAANSAPIDKYLENIVIEENELKYDHDNHGVKHVLESPLKNDFDSCNQKIFSDKEYKVSKTIVSRYEVVEQLYRDNAKYGMRVYLLSNKTTAKKVKKALEAMDPEEKKKIKYHNRVFSSFKDKERVLSEIIKDFIARDECLNQLGWKFYKKPIAKR